MIPDRGIRGIGQAVAIAAAFGIGASWIAAQTPAAGGNPNGGAKLPASRPVTAEEPENELDIAINQVLDGPISLDLKNVTLREAIDKVSQLTSIPIEIEKNTPGYLPYGTRTRLNATIKNGKLRDSLTALLRPLGLRFNVDSGRLIIRPQVVLLRICRRASWDELGLLESLQANAWSPEFASKLKFQFQSMNGDDQANLRRLREVAAQVSEGTAARVLEAVCEKYGWSWYPSGDKVVILPRTSQIERQLDRFVTFDYDGWNLKEVLLDLIAKRGDVLLKLDPGVLTTIPPQTVQNFKLSLSNATIRQGLEFIAGETGLSYIIEQDGVRLVSYGPLWPASQPSAEAAAAAAASALRVNPIIGQVTLPGPGGLNFSLFVREQDLSAETNKLRQERMKGIDQAFQQSLRMGQGAE